MRRPNYSVTITTVIMLQAICEIAKLSTKGTKAKLVARIADHYHATQGSTWDGFQLYVTESAYACYYAESERIRCSTAQLTK